MDATHPTSAAARTGLRTRRLPLAAIGVTVLALASAGSVAAQPPGHHSLKVLFRGEAFTSTQEDPTGLTYAQGDQIFLGGEVLRFASPHERIGAVSLWCAATGADGSSLTCHSAAILPEGKIVTETLFETTGDWSQPSRKLAITGGTGAYRNARGELTVTTLDSGDEVAVYDFGD